MRPEINNQQKHFELPSHCDTILTGLNRLRQKQLLFDVTLIVGNQHFQAHKVVLASCSEYFRAMFTSEMKEKDMEEIRLNGVSETGMQHLLEYAYTSKLALNLDNVQHVLAAASHLQMVPVVDTCADFMHAELDLESCVDIATIADMYSLVHLQKRVYRFMASHFGRLSLLQVFQRLTYSQIRFLLSSHYPFDCAEADILQGVLSWIHADLDKNGQHTAELLNLIEYDNIDKYAMRNIRRSTVWKHLFQECPNIVPTLRQALRKMAKCCRTTKTKVPNMINPRGFEKAIINVGGIQYSTGITNTVTYYHTASGRWKHLTKIPHVDQCNFGLSVLNHELYVVGGCFNQSLQEHIHPFGFRYNPRRDKWTPIAPLRQERCRFYLAAVGNNLFAIGGASEQDNQGEEGPCEKYDPRSNRWTTIPSLPCNRVQHAGASVGNHIFICGGLEYENVVKTTWCFDVSNNTWTKKADMLVPRVDHCMVAVGQKLYVAGGCRENPAGNRVIVDSVDCLDVATNTWTTISTMPTPRYHASMVEMDQKLYVIGGFGNAVFDRATKKVEIFDLKTQQWTNQDDYPIAIWEHASCLLYLPTCRDDDFVHVFNSAGN